MFPGRAQSVISGRLGELSERHGNTRALIRKLWFVNGEGKRVLVWALTPSGYALAGEEMGRLFKVPRHDVAHQFLEHATGVNDLYVALTKSSKVPQSAQRGRPADDFARVPTAFRWVASEDLELPFQEYMRDVRGTVADRRLQPDAMLEDLVRKRRYFIEYETGSATVRNAQHKTATLTKLGRYSQFILGFTNIRADETYYGRHFRDGYNPVVVFLTRTAARSATIRDAAEDRWRGIDVRFEVRALTVAEACADFRAQLVGQTPSPAAPARPAQPDGIFVSRKELEFLSRFQDDALRIIQSIRHSVRAGRPVTTEPNYPESVRSAALLMQKLLESTPNERKPPDGKFR
jgi:hypothetical protein